MHVLYFDAVKRDRQTSRQRGEETDRQRFYNIHSPKRLFLF